MHPSPGHRAQPMSAPRAVAIAALLVLAPGWPGPLSAQEGRIFTRADTLRGSIGPARAWWDVTFYDLHVRVSPADSTISGRNGITYRVVYPGQELQIDLQPPLEVDSMVLAGERLAYRRDGNAFFVTLPRRQLPGEVHTVTVHYGGRPIVAVRPPWDGGFIWARDGAGRPWVATANQGLGASAWWPNKDHGSEEPDSQRVAITVPDPMVNVSNGRLRSTTPNGDGTTTYEWFVSSPINNYGVAVNAGSYVHWRELYEGEAGALTLDFWPLAENEGKARTHWQQLHSTMRCFEHWFGPYPFYEDGFKLIETPHLGMEHQSAVAYGNRYMNGYLGTDLSGSGHGLLWDFIIIHEAAHEWFANNITAAESGDLWIHESFGNYAENLYTECLTGSERAGAEYVIGTRARITNERPIIGPYGVNDQGPGDKYYKGGNVLHTLRQLVEDDERWRQALRGLNEEFRHQTVSTAQVEAYLGRATGIPLAEFFQQYLRTTLVPTLEVRPEAGGLAYRWTDVVPGFDMPVRVSLNGGPMTWIHPEAGWKTMEAPAGASIEVDDNFYVLTRVTAPGG